MTPVLKLTNLCELS